MGYELHITRRKDWSDQGDDISLEEFVRYMRSDTEFTHPGMGGEAYADWKSPRTGQIAPLWWSDGTVVTKNPDAELVDKMVTVATKLQARLQGDDGEIYLSSTRIEQIESDPPPLLNGVDTRLRYITTRSAVVRGTLRAMLYNRALLWYMAVLLVFVTVLSFRDYLAKGTPLLLIAVALLFQLVLIGLVIIVAMALVTLLGLHLNKGRGVVGEHQLELTEAGLTERTDVNESLHRWKGLGEIRETGTFYFIRTVEGGGAFHLVPKCGHILEGDPHTFVVRLKQMKARATTKPPS